MAYNFDKKDLNGKWETQVDSKEQYGCFENQNNGNGGGLWFCDNEITDYDGVFELPKAVIESLEKLGFKVGAEFKS